MVIGEYALIPENIDRGYKEWLAAIPAYRVVIMLFDGTVLEQFVPTAKEADKLLGLVDKAIVAGAPIRDKLREMHILGDDDDD